MQSERIGIQTGTDHIITIGGRKVKGVELESEAQRAGKCLEAVTGSLEDIKVGAGTGDADGR